MEPDNTAYNLPQVLLIKKEIDTVKLEQVFQQLIRRHESTRTSFTVVNEEFVQAIHHEDLAKAFQVKSVGRFSPKAIKRFIRPFDLSRAPLLRVELLKTNDDRHMLLVDIHHVISDGVSAEILVRELAMIYNGQSLAKLPLQYKDYAEWQNKRIAMGKLKDQEDYWLREFADEIPVLDLPVDFPRPPVQEFAGSLVNFEIKEEETRGLNKLAKERGVTLYMVLLAALDILLARLCGREDTIVGTVSAGRRHAGLEPITGMFVNTLALRNSLAPGFTFETLLQQVKAKTLNAFENQDYTFEDLVEKL
jgi:NRPS condensation-like uncharacterized protein